MDWEAAFSRIVRQHTGGTRDFWSTLPHHCSDWFSRKKTNLGDLTSLTKSTQQTAWLVGGAYLNKRSFVPPPGKLEGGNDPLTPVSFCTTDIIQSLVLSKTIFFSAQVECQHVFLFCRSTFTHFSLFCHRRRMLRHLNYAGHYYFVEKVRSGIGAPFLCPSPIFQVVIKVQPPPNNAPPWVVHSGWWQRST